LPSQAKLESYLFNYFPEKIEHPTFFRPTLQSFTKKKLDRDKGNDIKGFSSNRCAISNRKQIHRILNHKPIIVYDKNSLVSYQRVLQKDKQRRFFEGGRGRFAS